MRAHWTTTGHMRRGLLAAASVMSLVACSLGLDDASSYFHAGSTDVRDGGADATNDATTDATPPGDAADAGADARRDAGQVSNEGLVVYYNFDETSGPIAHDSSPKDADAGDAGDAAAPNKNDATLSPGAQWVATGKVGGAVSLPVGGIGYIDLPPNMLDAYSTVTVAAWIYVAVAEPEARLFDFGGQATMSAALPGWCTKNGTVPCPTSYYYFTPFDNGVSGVVGAHAELTVTSDAGVLMSGITIAPSASSGAVPSSTWTHITTQIAEDGYHLWVNGVLAATTPPAKVGDGTHYLTPKDIAPTSHNYIGRSQFEYLGDSRFHGRIDEFRVYSRALTPEEIAILANP